MSKIKTYWYFWALAIPFLLFGFIFGFKSTLDIALHDTYFVMSLSQILITAGLIFIISGRGYLPSKLNFNLFLNTFHFGSTFLAIGIIAFPMIFVALSDSEKGFLSLNERDFQNFVQELNNLSSLGLYILTFGILTYCSNLGIAIFQKRNEKN